MTKVSVRLPERLLREVDAVVERLRSSRSDLVRTAIERHLYRLACEQDAAVYERTPLRDTDLALADDPQAWSPTPQC